MNSRTSLQAADNRSTRQQGPARPANDRFDELWALYQQRRELDARNALIEAYLPIVRREARKIAAALGHVVSAQELESAGTLGLMDSIRSFEPAQGFKFVTFCTPRVRGAMLDELRAWDWTPRATRAKLNRLERAIKKLEGKLGRAPDEEELAREMETSQTEVRRLFVDRNRTVVSLDRTWSESNSPNEDPPMAILEDKRGVDPVRSLQKKEITESVRQMLTDTERLVVTLYYYEQLKLHEIGQVLSLTESRISQIHGKIVARMRKRFAQ